MTSREDWDFYLTRVGERPAAIFCDLAAEPDPAFPVRLRVLVRLQCPRPEDGLATADESPALNAVEDALVDRLSEGGARYVGRWTCNGFREFVFYAPGEAALEARLQAVAEAFPEYRPTTDVSEDEGWDMFRDLLLPGRWELQWILDRRVVTNLREAGDDNELPRPVDHYAYFGDAGARDAFLRDVRALGFSAEATLGRIGAHLVRTDPVELEHIHEVVCGLIDLVDRHGGEYDGWGAPVVRTIG
jgi:hypothetical protein